VGKVHRLVLASAGAIVLALAGCGGTGGNEGGGGGGDTSQGGAVALLLPEAKTARYEAHDRPEFEAKLKELCSDCRLLYYNADQDASKQQQQVDAALTNGAKVLVLDPVDSESAASLVNKAKAQNVSVVSYDRLITGGSRPDYYISFDNEQVGKLQGEALLQALRTGGDPKRGPIVMVNGAPTDNNAKLFKKGAHSVLDGQVTIGREYDTPDWSPDKAQQQMDQAITALGKNRIIGVYAANDGTAGGAIAAMKAAGMTPLPPVTGQDAELAGIQRVIAGEQYMTVYKATKAETAAAADLAVQLLRGKKPVTGRTVNNGAADIPSILLAPVTVTKDNVEDTVVKDGFWTAKDICTGAYAQACAQAGIR
jgi:D-xylose transport system substrate-binding protein